MRETTSPARHVELPEHTPFPLNGGGRIPPQQVKDAARCVAMRPLYKIRVFRWGIRQDFGGWRVRRYRNWRKSGAISPTIDVKFKLRDAVLFSADSSGIVGAEEGNGTGTTS